MEKAGVQHINKKRQGAHPITGRPVVIPSFFAQNWRKYSRG